MIHISLQAMRYLFDHDNLKGSELLVALAIYDRAGFEGDRLIAYPGHKLIAKRARISERSVRRIIAKLENQGYWRIVGGLGRGNVQGFELLKEDAIMSAFKETKSGHPKDEKRSSGAIKSGHIESPHNMKNILEDKLKKELREKESEAACKRIGVFN